ncbi:MAG: class I SAM-dependent DNA methyltransferase [Comamonas sp.]
MAKISRRRLTTNELRKRLTIFANKWQGASSEKADEKIFTADFLACFDIGAHHYEREFEVKKQDGKTGYMDGFIPGQLIIEGKSFGKDLKKARKQAEEYRWACAKEQQPRFVLLHDFAQFALFDLTQDSEHTCALAELPKHAEWFRFLVDDAAPVIAEETQADRRAAEQMAVLHDALLRSNFSGRDLEVFLTRLLFCLFADDTAIFGDNGQFLRLVKATREDGKDLGSQLTELFDVLNTPHSQRSNKLDEDLAAFEYINGKLFEERTRIPAFDSDLRRLLLDCVQLDWSAISPAIFGAMFQSVLEHHEPDKSRTASRRELGAHYTSERNILRAINPLFMDGLRAEFKAAGTSRTKQLALYEKLPTLRFFDPACGCGNFLVIAYRELRRLEMDLIAKLFNIGKQIGGTDRVENLSRVHVGQFYGIEIDASAAHIAQVAMWITDHQMNLEAAGRFGTTRPSVPLVQTAHIRHGNALRTDWADVLAPGECSYIVGNPPFVGYSNQTKEQKADLALVYGDTKGAGVLDYVAAWYLKAARYMQANPAVHTSFVSTNSLCQGEQVAALWALLLPMKAHIHFAHRTFKWSNEGRGVAAVHCVIVGFALCEPNASVRVFDYGKDIAGEGVESTVSRLNPYLVDAPTILLEKRRKPLQAGVPEMIKGSQPTDGGSLLLSAVEAAEIRANDAIAARYIRPFLGADEFINNTPRYCLWLGEATSVEKASSPSLKKRLAAVRAMRSESTKALTQAQAQTPHVFGEDRQPSSRYLLIPRHSSENREFIPIGYFEPEVICGDANSMLPNAAPYHFGMLSSTMHNAWMRTVAGRLKSDYRYSNTIVYNNYPWPAELTDKHRLAVEKAAQAVLDARQCEFDRCAKANQHASMAMLYNPDTMPAELVKAHAALDKAVDAAYGYKGKKDDASRVAYLFELYQALISQLETNKAKPSKAKSRSKASAEI